MSGKKQKAPFNAVDVAAIAKSNPYIQRLVADAKLRNNLRTAVDSSRHLYDRVSDGKTSARSLLEDKKAQAELRKALEAMRDATLALTEPPKKRRLRVGRLLLLLGIGGGAALAASEKLRSKVLDLMFGAEEEFEYTPPPSTATPSTPPAPADVTTSSPPDEAATTGTQSGSAPGSA